MKKTSTIFLQVIVLLLGLGALTFLLVEPWFEGVNAHATSAVDVYLHDPFLALVYVGSIAFFVALYHAYTILARVRKSTVFSLHVVRSLRIIKHCALVLVSFIVVEGVYIALTHGDDDAAGVFVIGAVVTFTSLVIATAASMFANLLQAAVELKTENDLTV